MSLLQNEDFKTEAQLLAAGGAKSQLLNDTKVYISANAINKTLDDAIIDGDIGGGGQGGINYIDNYDFELNATGWGTYQDAAGERPVDATGGTATITLTRTTTTPLRGTASGLLSKPASNRQGEGGNFSFTIDAADQGKMQEISFDYTVTTNYADGYLRVFIYDVTNGVLIEPSQRDILANSGQAKYVGYWQAASNSTSYRLAFHVATNLTTAWDFEFDNVRVGPIQSGNAGTFVSDWQSYTPTFVGWNTTSNVDFIFRRVGDSIQILGRFTAGTANASIATVSLPSGLTIAANFTGNRTPGIYYRVQNVTAKGGSLIVSNSSSTFAFGDPTIFNSGSANPTTPVAGTAVGGSQDLVCQLLDVPIQGWSTGVSASEISSAAAIGFRAYRATSYQNIASAAQTTVQFNAIETDTAGGFNTGTFTYIIPESGLYQFDTYLYLDNLNINEKAIIRVLKNGTSFLYKEESTNSSACGIGVSGLSSCNRGDAIIVRIQSSGDTSYDVVNSQAASFFSAFKINNPAQIAPTEFVGCSYNTDTAATFAQSGYMTYEDKVYDTHGFSTNGQTFTIPVSGKYQITAVAGLAAVVAAVNNYIALFVEKNGSNTGLPALGGRRRYQTTSSISLECGGTSVIDFNKGDTIKILIDESVANAQSLTGNAYENYIMITKVS